MMPLVPLLLVLLATSPSAPRPVGTVAGRPVTSGELAAAAARRVESLDLLLLEAQARHHLQVREAHEAALEEIVARRLVEAEAAERGITVEALLDAEIESRVREPRAEDVEKLLAATPEDARRNATAARAELSSHLRDLERKKLWKELQASLAAKHGVSARLPEERAPMDLAGCPASGPENAAVTIVEFGDFECEFCGVAAAALHEIAAKHGSRVRRVFRHFPLASVHEAAQRAAEGAACAAEQGRFWEVHDRLFALGGRLDAAAVETAVREADLDLDGWRDCLASGRGAERVRRDVREGVALGVSLTGTPGLFVNGRRVPAEALSRESLAAVVVEELARASTTPVE